MDKIRGKISFAVAMSLVIAVLFCVLTMRSSYRNAQLRIDVTSSSGDVAILSARHSQNGAEYALRLSGTRLQVTNAPLNDSAAKLWRPLPVF
ncbi:hypothetical protein AGMMS49941_12210 [Deferribacterales bacterium]|nr:hypothetical protein AGMMS49941_12210 [Deferribacterales bacterium]